MRIEQTPSQTVGPFFAFALKDIKNMVTERTSGQRIRLIGSVFDGDGQPVSDALVELWQADSHGIYNHPEDPRYKDVDTTFHGFGRSGGTVDDGFEFKTIKPGRVPDNEGGLQAPHIGVRIFSRGMLVHATSRIYFSDEPSNESDALLLSVPVERRQTLIAGRQDGRDLPTYRFDIHLQGKQETVFFDP